MSEEKSDYLEEEVENENIFENVRKSRRKKKREKGGNKTKGLIEKEYEFHELNSYHQKKIVLKNESNNQKKVLNGRVEELLTEAKILRWLTVYCLTL